MNDTRLRITYLNHRRPDQLVQRDLTLIQASDNLQLRMRINEWTKIRKKGSKLKKNETELKEMSDLHA
jgi:hypothetical protein